MDVWALAFGIIGTVVSILTFTILAVRGVLSVENRITKLETKMEPFYEGLKGLTVDALKGIRPPGNPIAPERYDYLIDRMDANTLTQSEAEELNAALQELHDEAQKKKDLAKLLAVGLGLVVVSAFLKQKK